MPTADSDFWLSFPRQNIMFSVDILCYSSVGIGFTGVTGLMYYFIVAKLATNN